ncbi:hypothetical protein P20495_1626 [Pseudoalteromonas sp. BSi20495]|nr:hypothetical protein P20495_1626 [Pseudoalteromonas sp. BSi20495]
MAVNNRIPNKKISYNNQIGYFWQFNLKFLMVCNLLFLNYIFKEQK